jgi:hypothetical protein
MSNARTPPVPTTSQASYTARSRAAPANAATLPSSGPPTTPALVQPTPTLSPLRDPKPLLGCKLRPIVHEYEHFPPSVEHYLAAQHVTNSFGEAMYKTKQEWRTKFLKTARLSDYAPLVTSRFAMCGITGALPEPAIIVECPSRLLSRVAKELQTHHMKNQYAVGFTSGPAFTLYYCGRDTPSHQRTWCKSIASLNGPDQSLSLCGTRMSSVQHIQTPRSGDATVACLLEIKGELYALGPAHIFTKDDAARSQEELLAELLQMEEDEDDDNAFDDDDDDDDDDDNSNDNENDDAYISDTSEEDTLNSNATPSGGLRPSPPRVLDDPSINEEGLEDLAVMFPGPDDLQNDNTDGDWAVTLIKKPYQQLPNLYLVEQQASKEGPSEHAVSKHESPKQQAPKLRHIVEIASEPSKDDARPIEEKTVHILTSSSTKQGTLLTGFANISGLSDRGHCNVHIVSIDDCEGIVAGDSGSLVVDAQSSVAYGHVVATNPQGYAYVVPLYTTVRQMKAFFETANVRLPEPLHLLSRLALHYITTKQSCQAEEAIFALTDLVQNICDSRQWERLAHWIRTSTARTSLLDMWDDKLAHIFVSPR